MTVHVECAVCVSLRHGPGLLEDIADRHGMTVTSVRRHARRHGVNLARFDVCWMCLEVQFLVGQGAVRTVPELADRVGLKVEHLRVHLRRHDVPIPAHLERVPA